MERKVVVSGPGGTREVYRDEGPGRARPFHGGHGRLVAGQTVGPATRPAATGHRR